MPGMATVLSISLPEELAARLRAQASAERRKISGVVRMALEGYLEPVRTVRKAEGAIGPGPLTVDRSEVSGTPRPEKVGAGERGSDSLASARERASASPAPTTHPGRAPVSPPDREKLAEAQRRMRRPK